MHKYLSAIGFKHIESKQQLNKLLEFTETSFQVEKTVKIKDDVEVSERIKHFTKDMGLMVCGTYDLNDKYEREHYIPFFLGKGEKKFEELAIERHISKNSYCGACEYPGIGITLIYYLQNGVEVTFHDGKETRNDIIYMVDYDNIHKNTFQIINQWTYVEKSEKRADLIVFINDLALDDTEISDTLVIITVDKEVVDFIKHTRQQQSDAVVLAIFPSGKDDVIALLDLMI